MPLPVYEVTAIRVNTTKSTYTFTSVNMKDLFLTDLLFQIIYHKILNDSFWPGLKSETFQHCKSCHTCQMVEEPNQTIPKVYLQPIPAFDKPLAESLLTAGRLPKTKSDCQYLLTIMCA